MTRINIEVDERLLGIVMRRHGLHTRTEAIDLALRHMAGQPMTIEEALCMRGAGLVDRTPVDTGP